MKLAYVEAPEVRRSIEKDPGKVKGDLGDDVANTQALKVVSVITEWLFDGFPWVKFLDLCVELVELSLTFLYILHDSELLYDAT